MNCEAHRAHSQSFGLEHFGSTKASFTDARTYASRRGRCSSRIRRFRFAPIEPARAADAAKLKGHMVTLIPIAGVKALTDAYRAAWQALGNNEADMPLLGRLPPRRSRRQRRQGTRHRARQPPGNGATTWRSCGNGPASPSRSAPVYPNEFEALEGMSMGVAGSPETVRRYVADSVEKTGITYFVADIAFGSPRCLTKRRRVRSSCSRRK